MKKLAQPTRSFFTLKISWKTSPGWLKLVFHFGTENRADQLKKPPCIMFLFSVESVFKFSLAAGAEIRLVHLVTETVFFYVFSFFSFFVLFFFMSGGDISLTQRGLIGAKTAELPQTLSRVSKLSFCQIERKMLSDRNYLELRKCDQSLSEMTINRQFTCRR